MKSLEMNYKRARILRGSLQIRRKVNTKIISANGKDISQFIVENREIDEMLKDLKVDGEI